MPAFLILIFSVVALAYIGATQSLGNRCSRIYEGPAFERCIHRPREDGPLYEENIGKIN